MNTCAVEVVKRGGSRLALVEKLAIRPHLENLVQHVRGLLGVPGCGILRPVDVNELLDSGLGVTPISEALVAKHQQEMYDGHIIKRFRGSAHIWTSLGDVRTVEWQPSRCTSP